MELRAIGKLAVDLLIGLPRPHGSPWAFPASRGDGHHIGIPGLLKQVCAVAELEGITVHVLRHSFAATAAGMGFSELTIAGLLGHKMAGVTARYAHMPDSALVAAANAVAERICQFLSTQLPNQ